MHRKNNTIFVIIFLIIISFSIVSVNNLFSLTVDFTLKNHNGEDITLSDFTGKYILLDFSAVWCGPCNYQAGYMNELEKKLEKYDFVSITILVQDKHGNNPSIDVLEEWANDYKLDYILGDDNEKVKSVFNVKAYPTNIILDPNLNEVERWEGAYSSEDDVINYFWTVVPELFQTENETYVYEEDYIDVELYFNELYKEDTEKQDINIENNVWIYDNAHAIGIVNIIPNNMNTNITIRVKSYSRSYIVWVYNKEDLYILQNGVKYECIEVPTEELYVNAGEPIYWDFVIEGGWDIYKPFDFIENCQQGCFTFNNVKFYK